MKRGPEVVAELRGPLRVLAVLHVLDALRGMVALQRVQAREHPRRVRGERPVVVGRCHARMVAGRVG